MLKQNSLFEGQTPYAQDKTGTFGRQRQSQGIQFLGLSNSIHACSKLCLPTIAKEFTFTNERTKYVRQVFDLCIEVIVRIKISGGENQ